MTDYIGYITAGTLLIFSTIESEIPNVIQQSIAITVLLIVLAYQMTRQEKMNKAMTTSIDKHSQSVQELINTISILVKQSEQNAQDNRDTVKLFIEHIQREN